MASNVYCVTQVWTKYALDNFPQDSICEPFNFCSFLLGEILSYDCIDERLYFFII